MQSTTVPLSADHRRLIKRLRKPFLVIAVVLFAAVVGYTFFLCHALRVFWQDSHQGANAGPFLFFMFLLTGLGAAWWYAVFYHCRKYYQYTHILQHGSITVISGEITGIEAAGKKLTYLIDGHAITVQWAYNGKIIKNQTITAAACITGRQVKLEVLPGMDLLLNIRYERAADPVIIVMPLTDADKDRLYREYKQLYVIMAVISAILMIILFFVDRNGYSLVFPGLVCLAVVWLIVLPELVTARRIRYGRYNKIVTTGEVEECFTTRYKVKSSTFHNTFVRMGNELILMPHTDDASLTGRRGRISYLNKANGKQGRKLWHEILTS